MPINRVPAPAQDIQTLKASKPLFELGQVVATPAALAFLEANAIYPAALLSRHQHGDWGTVDAEDAKANDQAIQSGVRLLSVYVVSHVVIWAITDGMDDEGRRASTCLLFPEEY